MTPARRAPSDVSVRVQPGEGSRRVRADKIHPALRTALACAAAAATFVTATYGQSMPAPPSEANHFIKTPNGWMHPTTPG